MAGLTPEGLSIKRQQDIINSRITDAKNFFGASVSTGVDSVIGRLLRIGSADEADLWEVALAVYNSFNPDLATGVSLDRLAAFSNLKRQGDMASVVELFVTGEYKTVIPAGSTVASKETNSKFSTTQSTTLNESGVSGFSFEIIVEQDESEYIVTFDAEDFIYTSGIDQTESEIAEGIASQFNSESTRYTFSVVNGNQVKVVYDDPYIPRNIILTSNLYYKKISKIIEAEADTFGPVKQPKETLTVITSPVNGWDTVTNLAAASPGRFRESSFELRTRFKNSKEARSLGTLDAIHSQITTVDGVQSVQVYENTTQTTDDNGVPPKAIHPIILGGTTRQIGETLWRVKPAGISLHGSTTLTVDDSQGLPHEVSFSRPEPVPVKIVVGISEMENRKLPNNVNEKVVQNLLAYFNDNYFVGDDVIHSRLYQPLNNIDNLQVDSLLISRDDQEPAASNVVINYDEVVTLRRSDIVVNGVT